MRAARPGESPEQAWDRFMREWRDLQLSPFFPIWTSASANEILSALYERVVIGSDWTRARPVTGGVERRADVSDVERAARVDGDRHDVEAAAYAVEPSPLEVVLGQACQPSLLVPGDGGRRRFVPSGTATLDLDEDDHVVFTAHEIDLALGEPNVPLDHREAGALECARRFRFRRLSESPSSVRHSARFAPPCPPDNVQSFGQ